MKKIIILWSINCIFSLFGFSQQNWVDSLEKVVRTAKEDSNKVKSLNEITSYYLKQIPADYKKALQFGEEARLLGEKLSFERGAAVAYENLGTIYGYYGFYEKAFENFLNKLKIGERLNDSVIVIASYRALSFVYSLEGNFQKALEINLLMYKVAEASGNINDILGAIWTLAGTHINVCKQMIKQNNSETANYHYNKAIEYDLRGLRMAEQAKDSNEIAFFLKTLGLAYDKGNLCEESNLVTGTSLIKADYYNLVEENYLRSLEIYSKRHDKEGMLVCYSNLGLFNRNRGNLCSQTGREAEAQNYYRISLPYYIKSYEFINDLGFKHGIANFSKELGIAYLKLNKINQAKQYLLNAATRFTKIGYKEGAKESYEKLSEAALKINDYKNALQFYKSYIEIKDSLVNETIAKQQTEKIIEYETAKRETEISKLRIEAAAGQAKQQLQNSVFIGLLLISVLIIFIIIEINRVRSKARLIKQQNDLRENISNDLHDEVGTGLTAISMICNHEISNYKKEVPVRITKLEEIRSTSQKLSENLDELISPVTAENENFSSLSSQIRAYTYKFLENSTIEPIINLAENVPDLPVDPITSRNIRLILKEALNNIVKHSQATRAEIEFFVNADQNFNLQILDNGNGFNPQAPSNRNGLKSIQRRAGKIKNGKLELTSIPGEGTKLSVKGKLS